MKRSEAFQAIAPLLNDELVVMTVGGTTVEWHAVHPSDGNFQVKTLGLCSSVGLGLALGQPDRKVIVLDGDGALWMNMSSLGTIGWQQPRNLVHVCLDNGVYEASGGTPTATSARLHFADMAKAAGIQSSVTVNTPDAFAQAMRHALRSDGPHFIWCKIEAVRSGGLPFPLDEQENKYHFIRFVERTTGKTILRQAPGHSYEKSLQANQAGG